SLIESNLKRKPAVLLLDIDEKSGILNTYDTIFIACAKPTEEVFNIAHAEELKQKLSISNEFVAALAGTSVKAVSLEAIIKLIQSKGLEPDVEEVGIGIVQEVF
ncbi:unnamed protein product, partial [marine sediment metagenome]